MTQVRLTVTLRAGSSADTIALEPAHLERFFRTAAYAAIRDGQLDPAEPTVARVYAADIRERHGDTLCLDGFVVELTDAAGRIRARTGFARSTLAAFALRRAMHRLGEQEETGTHVVAYALHAVPGDDDPFPVAVPRLASCSLADLTAGAVPTGAPDDAWVATVVTPALADAFAALADASRAAGVEMAGRVAARVGYDPTRRCFVRLLDRLVVARDTRADAMSVVSTATSWGDFLAEAAGEGPRAITTVHTHLHLAGDVADAHAEEGGLSATGEPGISVDDLCTHYVGFPDPLSAAAIVSVFPDRREIQLYGYTPGAELRLEPGYWTRGA